MAAQPLIVPTLSPSGALHFAAVTPNATAQDIIDALSVLEEVRDEILGDLLDSGWAIQRIRKQAAGTTESDDGKSLGNGLLQATDNIGSILAASKPPSLQRHFSAFPLSSHLHAPSIRLVSLHPSLHVILQCSRIPGLDDDLEVDWFVARATTVEDVINGVIEEIGLPKVISGPGGGTVDYCLEEAWISGEDEVVTRLSSSLVMSSIVEQPVRPMPFPSKMPATRTIRICVPDEWYRRSKSRSLSLTPIESGGTLSETSSQTGTEEDESGGTAKQKPKVPETSVRYQTQQSRRFSLFDGWGSISSPPPSSAALASALPGDRSSISVSAPVASLQPQSTGLGIAFEEESELSEEVVATEFERMMDELGLKETQREAMRSMSLERKQYLIHQSRQSRSVMGSSISARPVNGRPGQSAASPETAVAPLSPQFTGGLMKRFSIWGAAASTSTPTVTPSTPIPDNKETPTEALPIIPQITGSLWGNWWTSSPREADKPKDGDRNKLKSTEWFVDGIRNGKTTDTRLAKHLISLRVHLSTAKVAWVEKFLEKERGMDALSDLLESLVMKNGKKQKLTDTEEMVLLEVVKCLRVLLNTAPGYPYVLQSSRLVTNITFTLHNSSPKLRALSSDLLAAVCVISLNEGHRLVLGALSDYRICYDESFRFDELVGALKPTDGQEEEEFEEGAWEARGATMGLIIALTSCSDSLEERIMLREEFSRRGLNEAMVALRYLKPPDSLLKQLDAYAEDKYEDEEDLREQRLHTLGNFPNGTASKETEDPLAANLVRIVTAYPDAYPYLQQTIQSISTLLDQEILLNVKITLLFIFQQFVQNSTSIQNIESGWKTFMEQFASAIESVVPEPFPSSSGHSQESSQELSEQLNKQVEALKHEVQQLQGELVTRTTELETLRSMPQPSGKIGGAGEMRGLGARLQQKERQVQQLQMELEQLKSEKSSEKQDQEEKLKRERERMKLKKISEEMATLKSKNTELDTVIVAKDKEILYLKRALESVYSRFSGTAVVKEESAPERDLDIQSMTNQTIEGLAKKEEEIKALHSRIEDLTSQLRSRNPPPTIHGVDEKDFKARVAPPPPPIPVKVKRSKSHAPPQVAEHSVQSSSLQSTGTVPPTNDSIEFNHNSTNPPPPPPPPPPPLPPAMPFIPIQTINTPSALPIPPPSPPPPAPAPPPFLSSMSSIPPAPAPPAPPPPAPPVAPPMLPSGIPGPPPPPPFAPPPGATRAPISKGPSKKLRPFFWNKLAPVKLQSTVWNELNQPSISLDLGELEEIFLVDNSGPAKSSQISKTTPKNQALTTLLDITRANNVAIMLARIKLGPQEIRKAILAVDDARLSTDDLKAMSKQLPSQEEIARLKDFGDLSKLAKADQYFGEIMHISRLSERLDCILYRQKLELEIAEVKPDLDMVRNAGAELKTSQRFKEVLSVILAVGNALNGNTFRGGARGFQLEALLKMKETKTVKAGSDCPTLLHYLAKVLMRMDASLVMFIEDLPHVEAAGRVSVQFLVSSVNSLYQGLERVKEEVIILKATTSPDPLDLFINTMEPFVMRVQPSVDALRASTQALETELRELLLYFAEGSNASSDATKPEDFFNLVLSFSAALQKAALEVHEAEPKTAIPVINLEKPEDERTSTIKGPVSSSSYNSDNASSLNLSAPQTQGRAAGRNTVGRGDVDQAILSIRGGQRRTRQNRPLSKMFLDGNSGQGGRPASRVYD